MNAIYTAILVWFGIYSGLFVVGFIGILLIMAIARSPVIWGLALVVGSVWLVTRLP